MFLSLTALLFLGSPQPASTHLQPMAGRYFTPPSAIDTTTGLVHLEADGTAYVSGDLRTSEALRFISIADSGGSKQVYYCPKTYRLVSLRVDLSSTARSRRMSNWRGEVLTARAEDSWRVAHTFGLSAIVGRNVFRVALPSGAWKIALVIPGYAPLVRNLQISGDDTELQGGSLSTACTLKARFREPRSGTIVSRWKATLRARGSASDLTKFLFERPIAENGGTLEYASLPAGQWDLMIENQESGFITKPIPVMPAADTVEMGDLFFSQQSGLRVSLAFPAELPSADLSLTVFELLPRDQRGPQLQRQEEKPKAELVLEFIPIAAEAVLVVLEARDSGLFIQRAVQMVGGSIAEVQLSLSPIRIQGTVMQSDSPIAGAKIQAGRSGRVRSQTMSGADGSYQMTVWASGLYNCVTEMRARSPFFEVIDIPENASEFDHDVALPSGRIVGLVSDASSGAPIAGAEVAVEARSGSGSTSQRSTFVLTTDEGGRFEGSNLRNVPLSVSVTAEHYAMGRVSGVLPSVSGTEVDVQLHRGETIRGRVVDDAGNPVSQVYVGVDPDGNDYLHFTRSGATGEFEFSDISAGQHLFVAQQCGYLLRVQGASVGLGDPAVPRSEPDLTMQLGSSIHPLIVHLEKGGKPAGGIGLFFEIAGIRLPPSPMIEFARRCGFQTSSDPAGELRVDYLPDGILRAFLFDGTPVGTFQHDASRSVWRISLP